MRQVCYRWDGEWDREMGNGGVDRSHSLHYNLSYCQICIARLVALRRRVSVRRLSADVATAVGTPLCLSLISSDLLSHFLVFREDTLRESGSAAGSRSGEVDCLKGRV